MNGYEELGRYVKLTRRGRGIIGERLKVHREPQTMAQALRSRAKGVWGMSTLTLRMIRGIMSLGEIQVSAGVRQRSVYLRQSFQISESFLAIRTGCSEGQRGGCAGGQSGCSAWNEEQR